MPYTLCQIKRDTNTVFYGVGGFQCALNVFSGNPEAKFSRTPLNKRHVSALPPSPRAGLGEYLWRHLALGEGAHPRAHADFSTTFQHCSLAKKFRGGYSFH